MCHAGWQACPGRMTRNLQALHRGMHSAVVALPRVSGRTGRDSGAPLGTARREVLQCLP